VDAGAGGGAEVYVVMALVRERGSKSCILRGGILE